MNLLKVLAALQDDITKLTYERHAQIEELRKSYNRRIKELQSAYEVNDRMNTACKKCDGTGKEWAYDTTAEDDHGHEINCGMCHGSGLIENTNPK